MEHHTLKQIEQILGYTFNNPHLLEHAFTHASIADDRLLSNERLEFLGDAVLGEIICEQLFKRFPGYLEGDLTKVKSMLVSRRTCAKICRILGLHHYIQVSKGISDTKALTTSLAACLFEAVIGAIYVDGGHEAAQQFILQAYQPMLDKADANHSQGNFKSLLQQYTQQHLNSTPMYELLDEKGPDHNKCFEAAVIIGDRTFASAWGTNKKEAEQKAAYNALVELGLLEDQTADVAE